MILALAAYGFLMPVSVRPAFAVTVGHASSAIDLTPSPSQALGFSKTSQVEFGYVPTLSIGSGPTLLAADLTGEDPINLTSTSAVGAMSEFKWTGAVSAALSLKFDVSAATKNAIKASGLVGKKNVPIQMTVLVYAYAPTQTAWYEAIGTPAQVALTGATSTLKVSASADTSVKSKTVYAVTMTLTPKPTTQVIDYSPADGEATAKPW